MFVRSAPLLTELLMSDAGFTAQSRSAHRANLSISCLIRAVLISGFMPYVASRAAFYFGQMGAFEASS